MTAGDVGSTCSINTSINTLLGASHIADGRRAIWQLDGEMYAYHGGPDGDGVTQSGNRRFAVGVIRVCDATPPSGPQNLALLLLELVLGERAAIAQVREFPDQLDVRCGNRSVAIVDRIGMRTRSRQRGMRAGKALADTIAELPPPRMNVHGLPM